MSLVSSLYFKGVLAKHGYYSRSKNKFLPLCWLRNWYHPNKRNPLLTFCLFYWILFNLTSLFLQHMLIMILLMGNLLKGTEFVTNQLFYVSLLFNCCKLFMFWGVHLCALYQCTKIIMHLMFWRISCLRIVLIKNLGFQPCGHFCTIIYLDWILLHSSLIMQWCCEWKLEGLWKLCVAYLSWAY